MLIVEAMQPPGPPHPRPGVGQGHTQFNDVSNGGYYHSNDSYGLLSPLLHCKTCADPSKPCNLLTLVPPLAPVTLNPTALLVVRATLLSTVQLLSSNTPAIQRLMEMDSTMINPIAVAMETLQLPLVPFTLIVTV